jgi:pyruvate kinase
MAFAAADIANEYNVDMIFVPTMTGGTAKMLAALRPRAGIMALCASKAKEQELGMFYGIRAKGIARYGSADAMFRMTEREAERARIRRYLVVFGTPNRGGGADTIKYVER